MSDSFFCRWVISGRGADPTRKPLKSLRKAPLNNGSNTGVKPIVKKASTLRKSSVCREQFEEYNIPSCRPTTTYSPPYQPRAINTTGSQHSHRQRNAPVPSIAINKSLLKGFFDPRDSTGPWKYTQCPKHHDQGTMCGSLHENEEYSEIHTGECDPNPWEVCKLCDCGNPLCKADSKLLAKNPKIRGSGPLYNMVLKRSRAE